MTLTEFLLARIAEDEANIEGDWASGDGGLHILSAPMHDRLAAECEAKRRIVREVETTRRGEFAPKGTASLALNYGLEMILHLLALPYASHPDYRDEWKP